MDGGAQWLVKAKAEAKALRAQRKAAKEAESRAPVVMVKGWFARWERVSINRYGKMANRAHVGIFEGAKSDAPKGLNTLDDAEFERAKGFAGQELAPYASRYDDVRG